MTEPHSPAGGRPSEDDVRVVDATGMPCPQPVIELARAVGELEVGDRVRLLADDEAAWVDVPIWCRMQRQQLVSKDRDGALHTFVVQKAH